MCHLLIHGCFVHSDSFPVVRGILQQLYLGRFGITKVHPCGDICAYLLVS